ncbi:uncharacterized protein TRIADDRAFT_15129, partial [Trichoplax adhaerens]
IYLILTASTVVGNIVVLYTFYLYPYLRVPSNLFIINLAITDILNAMGRNNFVLIGLIMGPEPYTHLFCNISGFINSLGHVVMTATLAATAICRYLVIVRSYARKITTTVVRRIILTTWCYAILNCSMPWLGWSRYTYHPFEFTCLPDWHDENNFSYIIFVFIIDSVIPCILLIACYWRIYAFISANANRMLIHIRQSSLKARRHLPLRIMIKNEIKITKVLFIICVLFMICILPYSIVIFILIPCNVDVSPYVVFYCGVLINLNGSLNPVLYAAIYPKLRKIYRRLGCYLC